jgi:peptidoglycan/LPS O-acetylase OafA/YrhL
MRSSRRWWLVVFALAVVMLMVFPAAAFASGNDVGGNIARLLKHYAGELYGGIVAVFSLVFLMNRRHTELAVFLFSAVVVAWMVFVPDQLAHAAEGIGHAIFG